MHVVEAFAENWFIFLFHVIESESLSCAWVLPCKKRTKKESCRKECFHYFIFWISPSNKCLFFIILGLDCWIELMLMCFLTIIPFLGNMLTFMVGSKQAFEVSLADVSQTQLQGKNEVTLEFHVDDTTGANEVFWYVLWRIILYIDFQELASILSDPSLAFNCIVVYTLYYGFLYGCQISVLSWFQKDSLMEISFHIPNSNTQFVGDENHPPAQVLVY